MVSVQREHEPARFKLVPFGGAGPLHALALASEVGIGTVLVPPRPGVASALGLLVADLKHDFAQTVVQRLDTVQARASWRRYSTAWRPRDTANRCRVRSCA